MKRLLLALVIMLAWNLPAGAAITPLGSLRAIHVLTNAEAMHGLPVAFEATVTYYRNCDYDLFVQDDGAGIYVEFRAGANLLPGDRVLVTGKTQDSFRPMVVAESVSVLRHGALPRPLPANFEQLVGARLDCKRVKLRAVVRSADMADSGNLREIYLQALMDGGYVDVAVNSKDESALKKLLDAEVEITGIATAKFDQRMQLTGSRIDVQSLDDVKILKPAAIPIEAIPVTPLESVLGGYRVRDLSQRVRVVGTITYYQPGTTVVLQNGSQSLWIKTLTTQPLQIGDLAEVTGFPDVRDSHSTLTLATIRDTHVQAPIKPMGIGWRELGFGGHAFNLLTTEGRVVRQVREDAIDEYVLEAEGHVFSAIYRHPPKVDWIRAPKMREIPVGSKVRVTGIGMFYTTDPFNGPMASDILLRSEADIEVITSPPWLSVRNLLLLAGALFALVLAVATRGWFLEHKMRRQTTANAARIEMEAVIERRRSRILEEINGTEPLAAILEHIVELVSFQMHGAPCWCEVTDGARLGEIPAELGKFRAVQQELRDRSGAALGRLVAAFDVEAKVSATENDSLLLGARLAVLAIEARRLYANLLHRSEFDQLTDALNRFALEKRLKEQIEEARRGALIFGLIYIDMDGFKQINDLYGHRVGDLYLQEVALRMKRQLRSHDLLARLGGDEFAALIPKVRNRAEAEEIAQRVEHCFDLPFTIEEYVVQGSASLGIAIYPEDATTADSMLSLADTAMYAAKRAKQHAAAV